MPVFACVCVPPPRPQLSVAIAGEFVAVAVVAGTDVVAAFLFPSLSHSAVTPTPAPKWQQQ